MLRATESLRARTFDLLIVGGGAYGAAAALEAARIGLTVALVERGDFASQTSANSLKILHGGLRYLQQLDLVRMRESIRARREWARLAPDLVRPLPCALATHGLGLRSRVVLKAALLANDIVSADRNSLLPDECQLPRGRLLSQAQYGALVEGVADPLARTGAQWWDAIALDTERLVMDLICRAVDQGAFVANYCEALTIDTESGSVKGVVVRDLDSGLEFPIRAHRVLCATGAGTGGLLGPLAARVGWRPRPWCHALNLVLRKSIGGSTALALPAKLPAVAGGLTSRGSRELFFVPWRGRTMVGTHYSEASLELGDPAGRTQAIVEFLQQINAAAPRLHARADDICFVHWGALPLRRSWLPGYDLQLDSKVEICDGSNGGDVRGLWTVQGPKFTTALQTARMLVPRIARGLTLSRAPQADRAPLHYPAPDLNDVLGIEAAAAAAATDRWARHLEDVVFRRTGIGSAGYPGKQVLAAAARGMAGILNWSEDRSNDEVLAVQQQYRDKHCWDGREPQS